MAPVPEYFCTELCYECPKPGIKEETQTDSNLSKDIKKRKCSRCKKLGHCMSKGEKIKCSDMFEK